jgi:multidrug resistance efflux pump
MENTGPDRDEHRDELKARLEEADRRIVELKAERDQAHDLVHRMQAEVEQQNAKALYDRRQSWIAGGIMTAVIAYLFWITLIASQR